MRKNNLNLRSPNQWKLSLVFSTHNTVEVRSLQHRLNARGIPSLFRYHPPSCEVLVLQRFVGAAERIVSELQQERDSGDNAPFWQQAYFPVRVGGPDHFVEAFG